jgi:Icc protein
MQRALLTLLFAFSLPAQVRFAILGDRTGGANSAVYERVWVEVAREHPAFVINVGDTIEGLHDDQAVEEWKALRPLWAKYAGIPIYFTAGNHDIWSALSEKLYVQETKRPASYSFTFKDQVHITVLDNGRTNSLSDEQLQYLEADLKAAPANVPRMVFFHVPFWIVPLTFQSGAFELHRIARQYGVAAVVSGHGHQFVKLERDGIQYLEAGSSGGSLQRGLSSGQGAAEGWSYGWTLCTVNGGKVQFEMKKPGL